MSDSISNLAAAMSKAQASMGGAHKDANNPAFNSKYADLSSVVDAVKPHLTANGLSYQQFPVTGPDGVGVETLIMHASGEWIQSDPFYIPVAKANAHGFGSALTYARRYGLAAACGLKADDDDGNAAAEAPPDKKGTKNPAFASAHTARDVAVDALAGLDPETQTFLREKAIEIIAVHEDKGDVFGFVERQNFDTEEKLGIWSILPSNVRSAIKAAQKAHNQAKAN